MTTVAFLYVVACVAVASLVVWLQTRADDRREPDLAAPYAPDPIDVAQDFHDELTALDFHIWEREVGA